MIELPDYIVPNGVRVIHNDFGFIQRSAAGATPLRVNRAGNRFTLALSFPPMTMEDARVAQSRFRRAKRDGLRVEYPLLDTPQGSPGDVVVDGAGQSGRFLNVTGGTPGYAAREGYAVTLIDGDGLRYLNFVSSPVMIASDGTATLELDEPLRAPLPDGATVDLAKPTVEGLVLETLEYALSVDRLVRGSEILLEESAGLSADVPSFDSEVPTFDMDH